MDPHSLAEYFETKCSYNPERKEMVHYQSGRVVRAIIPVHLYGQTADMDPILYLANKYNVAVIEDACQAHGAEYYSHRDVRWKKAGSMGKAAAFSFYPGKNLGACGEAGAVTTNDESLAKKIRMLRDHGQAKKYHHDLEGYNGRLDAVQAGILRAKLKYLGNWNEKRRELARQYNEGLATAGGSVITPFEPACSRAVYHLYVIRVDDRQGCQAELSRQGIGTGIHYPVPLHEQKAYAHLGYQHGDFPVTEKLAAGIISLPMFPGLMPHQQQRVVETVLRFVSQQLEHVCGGGIAAD
jgi:dTDP-4-amino-4,6-dideoxygalactose transaminase